MMARKTLHTRIFYNALDVVKEKMAKEEKAGSGDMEAGSRQHHSAGRGEEPSYRWRNFQVPTEIRPERKESISMKNLILFARKRGGKSMAEKLAAEIMDAYNNQGGAFKRKEDMHRMAEANRAFAHFRF